MLFTQRLKPEALPIQPPCDFAKEAVGIRLEFERVLCPGIGDDILVVGGELVEETMGFVIADDAILASEQEQRRHVNVFGSGTQITVETDAFHEEAGSSMVQRQWVGADEFSPARRS